MSQQLTTLSPSTKTNLKTFDLIGFHSGKCLAGKICKFLTKSIQGGNQLSHVGLIIKAKDLPKNHDKYNADPSKNYILESKIEKMTFLKRGFSKTIKDPSNLTQLRDFDTTLRSYDAPSAKLVWGRLNSLNRQTADKYLENPENLHNLLKKYTNLRYNTFLGGLDMIAAVYAPFRKVQNLNRIKNMRSSKEGQFCSQLVANIFKDISILPECLKAEYVIPGDFMTTRSYTYGTGIVSVGMLRNNNNKDLGVPILFGEYKVL